MAKLVKSLVYSVSAFLKFKLCDVRSAKHVVLKQERKRIDIFGG